jgi:competence protein ComEA
MPPSLAGININTASIEELERLPRVGPKMAAAIVRFREENGSFQLPEELMQIHGMSEKKFLDLRPFVRTQ